jgi:hypothetical protein
MRGGGCRRRTLALPTPQRRPSSTRPVPALALRAVDEIKSKQREEYTRLTTLSAINDTLQFEPDRM